MWFLSERGSLGLGVHDQEMMIKMVRDKVVDDKNMKDNIQKLDQEK